MATIDADMTAAQTYVPTASGAAVAPGFYQIGSELIRVSAEQVETGRSRDRATLGRSAVRGIGGTTAASHSSGATITAVADPAVPGAGGGSLTVTDGSTEVVATSLRVPTVTDGGSGTAIVSPTVGSPAAIYYQSEDPGAVGAGGIWLKFDSSYSLQGMFVRNDADDGWLIPSLVGYGSDGTSPTPTTYLSSDGTAVNASVQDAEENVLGDLRIADNYSFIKFGLVGFKVDATGMFLPGLPTADPHVAGALWSSSGVVTVSAG